MRKNNLYFKFNFINFLNYFSIMTVSFNDFNSLFGFFILLVIIFQLLSGIMLSFSLLPDPMLIPFVRNEEDIEDLYIDDFFWLHERGVDFIFIFSYFHLFRKLYLTIFEIENELAWKSGIFNFLILQIVVFCGLILCCTHLSEITLTIAANIMHTFFLFLGKFYWWFFTDKHLNSDTLLRLSYAHYLSAFYLFFISMLHGIDMHYDWKNESFFDGIDIELVWWDEIFLNEFFNLINISIIVSFFCFLFYEDPETLSYEIFMWGDLGLLTDIRFYGVAPHWYFRPFMAWLIICPYHKTGVFGLLYFFFILYHQPSLNSNNEKNNYQKKNNFFFLKKKKNNFLKKNLNLQNELNFFHQFTFFIFLFAAFYTSSFLPYGKFFNRLGGNSGMLFSYIFVFLYLGNFNFKQSIFLKFFLNFIFLKSKFFFKN